MTTTMGRRSRLGATIVTPGFRDIDGSVTTGCRHEMWKNRDANQETLGVHAT